MVFIYGCTKLNFHFHNNFPAINNPQSLSGLLMDGVY